MRVVCIHEQSHHPRQRRQRPDASKDKNNQAKLMNRVSCNSRSERTASEVRKVIDILQGGAR